MEAVTAVRYVKSVVVRHELLHKNLTMLLTCR